MERLKELRLEKGLTQVQLGKIIGFDGRTIGQYERRINEPDIKTIKKLCDFFEVSADYLLGFVDDI